MTAGTPASLAHTRCRTDTSGKADTPGAAGNDNNLHGVRGSVASPGFATARYGGNTSCVFIEVDKGQILILDAGPDV